MCKIQNNLDCNFLIQNEIREMLKSPSNPQKTCKFRNSLRNVISKYFSRIIKSCSGSSFEIEKPENFAKNLAQLFKLQTTFATNQEILETFSSKREKWVSLFCSKSIKQLEVYLLNFSSLISSYGFAKAGNHFL